ncbi:unnamed protein product, partial [Prorocentrum cordatum]
PFWLESSPFDLKLCAPKASDPTGATCTLPGAGREMQIAGASSALVVPLVFGPVYASAYSRFFAEQVGKDPSAALQRFGWVCVFVSKVLFTKLIPESYAIAELCGLTPSTSGLLVSVYAGAHMIGYGVLWGMFRSGAQKLDSAELFSAYAMAAICLTIGTVGFAAVMPHVEYLPGAWSRGGALLLCRAIAGVGGGMMVYAALNVASSNGTLEQKRENTAWLTVASAAGAGCGPILASASQSIRQIMSVDGFQFYDDVLLCLAVCMGVSSLRGLSRDTAEHAAFQKVQKPPEETPPQLRAASKRALLWCASLCCIRTFVMSGAEVATALILEESASWSRVSIGLAIGAAFLLTWPVQAVLDLTHFGTTAASAQVLLGGALLAALMMSRSMAAPLGSSWSLLAADTILLPQLMVVGGYLDGIMLSLPSLAPGPGMPSQHDVQLLRGVCTDGLGRLLGPPVARWIATSSGFCDGQDLYSIVQFCGIAVMIVVFKTFVFPAYDEARRWAQRGELGECAASDAPLLGDPPREASEVQPSMRADMYGEYWVSLPARLAHDKLTEGPFNLDSHAGAGQRLALVIRGESFREGRQHSRAVGSDAAVGEQMLASASHMSLIVEPFRQAGYDVEIFLQTRHINDDLTEKLHSWYGDTVTRTEFSDNTQSAYKPRKYNQATGKFETGPDYTPRVAGSGLVASWELCMMNLARSLDEQKRDFSHVLVIRADQVFKVNVGQILLNLDAEDRDKILYANKHVVHGPDGQPIEEGQCPSGRRFFGDRWDSADGTPSVSDQFHWFPFGLANVMMKCGFPGHQGWDKHRAWVGEARLGFLTPGPFESDPSKGWNPLFRLAGRAEQEATEAELSRVPRDWPQVQPSMRADMYGEYWVSLPARLAHDKLTEGPFNLDSHAGAGQRLALVIRGESFREGRQHSRAVGSDAAVGEQMLASASHMSLIVEPFRQAGYEVEIFLQTRHINDDLTEKLHSWYGDTVTRTEFSDNTQSAYKPRKYNQATGKFETGPDYTPRVAGSGLVASWELCMMNLARSLDEQKRDFSHVLVIRADQVFKVNVGQILLNLDAEDRDKILYANKHVVHGPDGQPIEEGQCPSGRRFFGDRWDSADGTPSVSDQFHWFPFGLANVMMKCGFPGHQGWDKHRAWVGEARLGFLTPGPFESDPSKGWNPLFRLAGRAEQEATEAELSRVPRDWPQVQPSMSADMYGEYWVSLPARLAHDKLTEGPFNLDSHAGAGQRLALVIRGESFREGRQHSRAVGSDAAVGEQMLASASHMSLIVEPFRQAGYEVEIFLQTRHINDDLTEKLHSWYGDTVTRTEFSDNTQSAYKPRKYNQATGKFETGPDYTPRVAGSGLVASWELCMMNLARSLDEQKRDFSHVLVIRADQVFKVNVGQILLNLDAEDRDKILYANKHVVHGPDGQPIEEGQCPSGRRFFGDRWDSADGTPSVSDQFHWFPFGLANVMMKCGFPGHQGWDKHRAWVGEARLGFLTPGPFESDPSKGWNPLFRLAGRAEQEATEAELSRVPRDWPIC